MKEAVVESEMPGMEEELAPEPPKSIKSLTTGLLSGDEHRAWGRPSSTWRVAFDFSLVWAQIFLGLGIFFIWPSIYTFVVAFLLVSGGQHGLYLLGHEFVHYLVFPKNRKLNDRIGNWLFCLPAMLPLEVFRFRHFTHHQKYSTDEDTKTVYRRDCRGWRLWIEILRSLCGLDFLNQVLQVRNYNGRQIEKGKAPPSIIGHLPQLAVCQLVIFGGFCLVNPLYYFALWALPVATGATLCNKIRAYMEHRPLAAASAGRKGPFFRGTPGPFVRTTNASWIERLFVCKINFCLHAEHHLFPQISYQHLPKVRERLSDQSLLNHPNVGVEKTYLSTLYKLWKEEEDAPADDLEPGQGAGDSAAVADER